MQQIDHPVFGALRMTHDIPEINMHWWEGAVTFPPTSTRVILDIHASPSGPNDKQIRAYTKLLESYSRVFETGRRKGDIPLDCADDMLERITGRTGLLAASVLLYLGQSPTPMKQYDSYDPKGRLFVLATDNLRP